MSAIDSRRRLVLKGAFGAGALALTGSATAARSRELIAAASPGETAGSGKALLGLPRHALVIGNSKYRDTPLRNPANDANAIAARLKGVGFEVVHALDASRAAMLEAIEAYGRMLAQKGAIGLFYFAGHGVQLAWRNYLIPVDAVIDNPDDVRERAVELNALLQGLIRAKNPMNVIILDACRDNPFGSRLTGAQRRLSQFDAPPRSLLAYSTAPGHVASDGEGEHGLYTENLLREMKVPEAKIEDVFKRVRLHVRRRTKGQQIPWESTSLEDDFYFVPPKSASLAGAVAQHGERRGFLLRVGQLAQVESTRPHGLRLAQAATPDLARTRPLFEEQLAIWEKLQDTLDPEPLTEFLLRYPSGYFSELAQFRLDQVLARQGERKIQVVSSPDNPFSKGTAVANTRHKVGDSYSYRETNLLTGLETGRFTLTIIRVTDTEVVYDNGAVTDLLGNNLRFRDGTISTGSQLWGVDYAVGKRWVSRRRRTRKDGRVVENELDVRVISRERITVPAGTFHAFVLEARGWNTGSLNYYFEGKYWIAPDEVRNIIAAERASRDGRGYRRTDREELVSYRQS